MFYKKSKTVAQNYANLHDSLCNRILRDASGSEYDYNRKGFILTIEYFPLMCEDYDRKNLTKIEFFIQKNKYQNTLEFINDVYKCDLYNSKLIPFLVNLNDICPIRVFEAESGRIEHFDLDKGELLKDYLINNCPLYDKQREFYKVKVKGVKQ